MYSYQAVVHLHDTDAAGRLFFANQFKFFHDAYESMMTERGLNFMEIFKTEQFSLPIVHARADYKIPLTVGDKIEIIIRPPSFGRTSVTFDYELRLMSGDFAGSGKTVHVAVDRKTGKTIPLPDVLKEKLA
jgi:1,4-dihydroxy-2-naphthoyl-CoA hydrolase